MTSTSAQSAPNDRQVTIGRATLILLMLTVATPMLAAYWVYFTGDAPTSTINKGVLITPATQVNQLPYKALGDSKIPSLTDKHWRVFTLATGECAELCNEQTYIARQVHKRLAKEAHRIQRFLVLLDYNGSALPTEVSADSGLIVVNLPSQDWQATFAASGAEAPGGITLVDQDGFAMMSYGQEHTGNDFLDDFKRLLKYSYD